MPKRIIDKDRESREKKINKAIDRAISSNYPTKKRRTGKK